jgi:hypothetical protein
VNDGCRGYLEIRRPGSNPVLRFPTVRATRLGLAAAAILAALVTSPRTSGAQTPSFPSQVELVTVDAIVLGAVPTSSPGGVPEVEASYLLRHAGGTVVDWTAPSLVSAVPGGPIVRLLGLPLNGLAEGDYELVLRALDRTTGSEVERVESFRLERSSGS